MQDQEYSMDMDEKAVVKIGADGAVTKCAKGLGMGECGYKAGAKVCGKCGAMAVQIKADDWAEIDHPEDDYAEEYGDSKSHRLATMGFKAADLDPDVFVCAFERKVLPGHANVCEACPGGCVAEGDMPALIEVEGFAEQIFGGKVLDSGYSDEADLFVVDVEQKDGQIIEAYFDGPTGEQRGWIPLDADLIGEKDAQYEPIRVIGFSEAANLAVKSIEGQAVSVEADLFEGHDAYVVAIDGLDGKAYDVWLSLDGEILAEDDLGFIDDLDAKGMMAEGEDEDLVDNEGMSEKRMYSNDERMEMAKGGMALPDGSYPIKDEEDLRNAIQAYGRAKDKNATREHIMKRARELDLEDLIPDNWPPDTEEKYMGMNDDEDPLGKSITDAVEDPELLAALMEFQTIELEETIKDII